jgi:2-polyprenyl-3-methyl-5-hydroxy-6-metoxy-1,4-benzoquinol methylase
MREGPKRQDADDLGEVQASNQAWWTERTMSYDWNDKIPSGKYSAAWFDEIDRRFIFGARLFAHGQHPFDQVIPLESLRGKRVLEIGCGMGLHSELIVRAGADLTAIDISETSVMATRRRFELKGLTGNICQVDAEKISLPDAEFDFIWSWGVIHHSSHTGRIIRDIHRLLKPGGESRVMVYSLAGMPAYISMMLKYSWQFWRGKSLDECLWAGTDGFTARYYSRDMLTDIFKIFFDDVTVTSLGQDADAIPLPRRLRRMIAPLVSAARQREDANRRGAFLFVTARK